MDQVVKKTIQPTSNLWHWHALAWSIAWDLSLYSHASLIVLPAALFSPKDQNMLYNETRVVCLDHAMRIQLYP